MHATTLGVRACYAKAGPESDSQLRALFQNYLRDMAEWFEFDAATAYDSASVWAAGNEVYLATVDGSAVGFALIGSGSAWGVAHDVHEFFIHPEFRRRGAGEGLAAFVWSAHPGEWMVRVLGANHSAVSFWRQAISSYTNRIYIEDVRTIHGRAWNFFRFRSGDTR